jgi:hypothetical protein
MILQLCNLQSSFVTPLVIGAPSLSSVLFIPELILGNLLTCSHIIIITLRLLWFYWFEDLFYIFSTDKLLSIITTVKQDSPSTANAALESFIRILISHEDTINQSAVRGSPDGTLSGSAGLGDAGIDQSNNRPEPVPNGSIRP